MASFVSTEEYYYKSFDVFKKKTGEFIKNVEQELEKSRGCDEMKIFNRAIEPNEYPCDLYKAAVKTRFDQQISFDIRHQTFEENAPRNQ